MTDRLVLALAQLNPVVGDIAGNARRLLEVWGKAAEGGADLVIAPELYLTGYPPEDFALKPRLLKTVKEALEGLARAMPSGPALLVGAPWEEEGKLYNAALLLDGGEIVARTLKYDLPNYGPFDEKRVYHAGPLPEPMLWRGLKLGVMICEDMWSPEVAQTLREKGAQILIVPNGSPFEPRKQFQRYDLARRRVIETHLPLVYVNQVGGQDELVFEGSSFALGTEGAIVAQAKAWEEDLLFLPVSSASEGAGQEKTTRLAPEPTPLAPLVDGEEAVYRALVTGLRDYVGKNGFSKVVLGLSGGIDSALVATLAVDALGAGALRCVMMPSPYTSADSLEDAAQVAQTLGSRLDTIPIGPLMQAFDGALAEQFMGCEPDVTEENIQARCRGTLLMALANKANAMVLAAGNKSEMATGYATLYGDMCGGFAPIKDVYKTDVYRLALWRNAHRPSDLLGPGGTIFSERLICKAPTAELKPGQIDADSLPPYDKLDGILSGLVEDDLGVSDMVARGYDGAMVQRVFVMLDCAEYKRRQAPPGPKVTRRHLTRDRRYPITNRYIDKWLSSSDK